MNRLFSRAGIIIALVGSCTTLRAVPVNYNELINGDLDFANPLNFTFDVGDNVISGLLGDNGGPYNTDFEAFNFYVPTGLSVTQATINQVDYLGNPSGERYYISGNFGPVVSNLFAPSPGITSFGTFPSGHYQLNQPQFTYSGDAPAVAAYTFLFVVVPEPTTLGLLGIAACTLLHRPGANQRRGRQRPIF